MAQFPQRSDAYELNSPQYTEYEVALAALADSMVGSGAGPIVSVVVEVMCREVLVGDGHKKHVLEPLLQSKCRDFAEQSSGRAATAVLDQLAARSIFYQTLLFFFCTSFARELCQIAQQPLVRGVDAMCHCPLGGRVEKNGQNLTILSYL
jgi:hypothetical protein